MADTHAYEVRVFSAGLEELRHSWGWYIGLGIVLIILGAIALGRTFIVTVASVMFFGWLLIAGGLIEAVHAFWRERWSGFFLDLFSGILYVVVGFMIVANPGASAAALTLLIAMFLIFGGIFRVVMALAARYPHWGWMLLHGGINLLLGVLIWRQWPVSGLWVIGLFVGIELLLNGWSLIMLGLAAKHLPRQVPAQA